MSTAVILAAGVAIMGGTLAAVCGYGPALDRVKAWRSARRPVRVAELTPGGWAEVVPCVNGRGYPLSMN